MTAAAQKADLSWSTACPDWKERIVGRKSLIPDLPIFDDEAERALRIFKRLRVPDIIGTPTYGEVCDEWVFDLVRVIFGSFDVKTKRRALREFFLLVPKKNGKSSIAAAIMVVAAILNIRPEAELLLIAPTKKIAEIAFKQAVGIIRLDEKLDAVFQAQNHQKTITHRVSLAVIIIKAAEADVITGSKATFILIDETHVFAMKAKAADIFVEIRGSLAARPDGFLLQITTQSKAPPAGVFKEELTIARQVRDGELDLPLLPILYELPFEVANDNGWRDPKTWGMVNPNLNRSVDEKFLRDELIKAEAKGTAALLLFASQHLNVEVGQSLGGWRGSHFWAKQKMPELAGLETLLEKSEVVTVGIDGGGLDDLLGVSVLGRHRETQHWLCWGHAWAQRDVLVIRKEIAQQLTDFEKAGELTFCDDATSDIEGVAEVCKQVFASGLMPEKYGVGLDPMGVAALVDELARCGIGGDLVTGVSQGFRLSSAVWGIERKLKDGTLWHGGQGLMSWCVGNARAEQRGNAVLITKETAGKAKIDPLVALFNAVKLMEVGPEAAGTAAACPWDDPEFSLVA